MLWAVFTLIAAAAQTARNAMQRELTATLGTVGATHVRFLFGFPFALLFLFSLLAVTGDNLPTVPPVFWPWVIGGALGQIAATALMLSAMGERSFVVAYAYIKTEPVQVALFGLIFLGDKVTPLSAAAILIATVGVIVISLKPRTGAGTMRSTMIGLAGGTMFALSAISYRGAILSLGLSDFVLAASIGFSGTTRPRGPAGHRTGLETLAVCRLYGCVRVGILVSRLRNHHGGQCAHACAGRGAFRAGCDAVCLQAAHHAARGDWHRAGGDRCRGAGMGLLIALVRKRRQRMKFDTFLGEFFRFFRRRYAVD
jgi:multidrug transporter EmrE-like cation transporter